MTRAVCMQIVGRLKVAGGWVPGATLVQGLSLSQVVLEDALADLVIAGRTEYCPTMGYRLRGAAPACHKPQAHAAAIFSIGSF